MVPLATEIITAPLTGRPSPVPALRPRHIPYYGVKEAVFPFNMFQEVDPLLGPEMRSTGEVLGLSEDFGEAYFKAQEATQTKIALSGRVFLSVNDRDKPELPEIARGFAECGFKLCATGGTADVIEGLGIPVERVHKLHHGQPHAVDLIARGDIDIVVNTPNDKKGAQDDSIIRKAAIRSRVFYVTTMAAARATIAGIRAVAHEEKRPPRSLQEFHALIREE